MKKSVLTWCIVFSLVLGLQLACNSGPTEQELALIELQGQITTIQQAAETLGQYRLDLATAQQSVGEIEAIKENKRTDEQKEQLVLLPASIEELGIAKDAAFEELQVVLAEFLTVGLNDFPKSEETKEGLRLYSEESMMISQDTVNGSGDYKKAIDTLLIAKNYHDLIEIDVYQPLLDKVAELDDWRYITEERFKTVQKKMTKDEVKAAVGVPYHGNIQEDKAKGVETWLFRKREGGAAAVYFKTKTGLVYGTKFDAIKTKAVTD